MLRFLFWRFLALVGVLVGATALTWLLHGGAGRVLRGTHDGGEGLSAVAGLPGAAVHSAAVLWSWRPAVPIPPVRAATVVLLVLLAVLALARLRSRGRREYVRLQLAPYRGDGATPEALVALFEVLHKRLLTRWWRRLVSGQCSVSLEIHHSASPPLAWLAVACPRGMEGMVETALQTAYPNCSLRDGHRPIGDPPAVLRLKKRWEFIKRSKTIDLREREAETTVNRLLTVMGACGAPSFVQLSMTPAPATFERLAKRMFKSREAHLSRERRDSWTMRDRSVVEDAELRGGLEIQHRPLFFVDLRVVAPTRRVCEQIASELRAEGAENHLVERGTGVRHGALGLYTRRVGRGEGNPLPSFHKGVFASPELAAIWQLPSTDYATVPFERSALPLAPAPPAIFRPTTGAGTLRDAIGPVSIHVDMRKQNTAVPGTVEQGKSSYLVATVAEDLRRDRCAVIVLDPKGDAAEAAVSLVPEDRTCTLLDFSHPTCGFNPLAVDAPADVIADYVVGALKNLFTDADIRASSDRYLRNAVIAVLAFDRRSTLWDAARLLSVGEEGYAYRNAVGSRVRTMPQFKEITEFFTAELSAQLADARGTTTAKLDAPVNKLARLLNSPSIKRVLLNDSLAVDFDRVIADGEVLVVKGALGSMGAGNTSVLMQLLVGMLDAALARQQDLVPADSRTAVALKVDEAPLVLNRGFAETMALKRSAGLETVAAWQTDSQWTEREVREQLDALFAHRVYFATASARDARAAVELTMAEFSDTIRPGTDHLSALGRPDVRLHLPKHHAIVSWTTPAGRQPPFVAQTIPMRVDPGRLALHALRQRERGGRHRMDLRQPHWDRPRPDVIDAPAPAPVGAPAAGASPKESPPSAAANTRQLPTSRAAAPSAPEGLADLSPLPATAAESYGELVQLDSAQNVRWAKGPVATRELDVDPLDLEMLALIASLGHVLTTQIHRRFNAGRAVTTTQRRLKRLADAGMVDRLQFHHRDGGGAPMCYVVTDLGREALYAGERLERPGDAPGDSSVGLRPSQGSLPGERALRQARHDAHVAGWALACERAIAGTGSHPRALRGADGCVMSPPSRGAAGARVPFGPSDLQLPGGRTPHDFVRTDGGGDRVAVERFETVRPDAVVAVSRPSTAGVASGGEASAGALPVYSERTDSRARARGADGARGPFDHFKAIPLRAREGVVRDSHRPPAVDVIVELDDRVSAPGWLAKLERYDHFLSGWSLSTTRYGRRREALPVVVFVCRDRSRARDCARRADSALIACRAYAGEYPFDWQYPGRARILFVAERDIHEGLTGAFGVPALPPEVRAMVAHEDPRERRAVLERRELLDDAVLAPL